MRVCLVVIIFVFTGSQFFGAEPEVYRIAVYAEVETNKTEGGELARLIADELRREKDVVIDNKSPYLIVSCGIMTHAHGARLVASVAFMLANSQVLEHFPLTAETLQSLAHQVVFELNKRELNDRRQRRTDQLRERPNQSLQPPSAAPMSSFPMTSTVNSAGKLALAGGG
jgi:hypothetical protein